jgi:hypothetical protein
VAQVAALRSCVIAGRDAMREALANSLRASAVAYATIDEQSGENLDKQMLDR